MSDLAEDARRRLGNGEDWQAIDTEIEARLSSLDLEKCRKRVRVWCAAEIEGNDKCGQLMGEVFETELGGVFRQKFRVDSGPTPPDELARDAAFLRKNWSPDKTNPSDDDLRKAMRQKWTKEQRYLIGNPWNQQPEHPPTTGLVYRHVVCQRHGVFPIDHLHLSEAYESARTGQVVAKVSCSMARMPPGGLQP